MTNGCNKTKATDDDTSITTLNTNGTGSIGASSAADTPPRINGNSGASVLSHRSEHIRRAKPPTKIETTPLPLPPVLVTTVTTPVVWETPGCSSQKSRKSSSTKQQQQEKRNQQQNKKVDVFEATSNDAASWPPLKLSCEEQPMSNLTATYDIRSK
ncbi:hypothetical protein SEMRO_1742_G294750.1 [Seminavis robusta]|uniref:Uncharacterized protein n=1 Tax=Seminavis robusta TaxID=568900 RepID=A0A9N8HU18_9STRA|nr:hypothetical protein SEMRO_1742_G294750.1 [Seminavis robusta]|eukprot:Sro1742_g294750.1 n/a (156) ;mRNA; r:14576-15043